MTFKTLKALVVIVLGIYGSYGKHFRGGSMSWKPINNGRQVEVTYRVGFKFDHTEPQFEPCTAEAQRYRTVLETDGVLNCDRCSGDDAVKDFTWICDDFDEEEDSAIGGNIVVYDIPSGQTKLEINHENCCWLKVESPDTGSGGRGWNMLTQVDLGPRESDGRINSSPVSAPIPLEKFYRGCTYNLQIAVTDPDNDRVKCRYMKTEECPDPLKKWNRACGTETSGLTINKDCSLTYNTVGVARGYHAVNVMIMDCPDKKCKKPYSKVPLLFLLDVAADSAECMKPSIIIPPSCKTIPPQKPFEMVVMAEAGDPLKPISKITSQKPYGMKASPMRPVSGYPNRMAITLSWTPSSDQIRQHSVCFSALDSYGYTSGRFCTFIIVTNEPALSPDPETSKPARDAQHEVGKPWVIQFNTEIQRPIKSAFIRIVDEEGTIVYEVESKSSDVTFSGSTIEINPSQENFPFNAGEAIPYEIQIDEGAAVPSGGGCMSEASQWNVFLKDNTNFAILPKEDCKSSVRMIDPDTCDLFLKQLAIDENGEVVRTDYNLCCSCMGAGYTYGSGLSAGPPAAPPGPPGSG